MRKSKLKKGINVLICLVMVLGLGISGIVPNASTVAEAANGTAPQPPDPFDDIKTIKLVPDASYGLEENTGNTSVPYKGKAGTDIPLIATFWKADGTEVKDAVSNIKWSVSGTGSKIAEDGATLITTRPGTVRLTANITSALDETKRQKLLNVSILMEHVPVDKITLNGKEMVDDVMDRDYAFTMQAGETLDLTGLAEVFGPEIAGKPYYAPTYQTITWTIDKNNPLSYQWEVTVDPETREELKKQQQSTRATVSTKGDKLYAPRRGQFVLIATINNGKSETGTTANKNFVKKVLVQVKYVPVETMEISPKVVTAGVDTPVLGFLEGENKEEPTNKVINWSMANAANTASGRITKEGNLTTQKPGQLTVRATIPNGLTETQPFVDEFDIIVIDQHIPVIDIKDVSTRIRTGKDRRIYGVVDPATATNNIISWRIEPNGTTAKGAFIRDNNLLTTTSTGVVKLWADIYFDKDKTEWEQTFPLDGKPYTVQVVDYFIPVTNITGVPSNAIIDEYLTLTAMINPTNADMKEIEWSVIEDGGTGAIVTSDQFYATKAGTATVRATIKYGKSETEDYYQDFDIVVDKVFVPVTGINKVPTEGKMMEAITLSGAPSPSTATNKTIEWSVANAGTTGAVIEKGKLTTKTAGTVVVRATIKNGKGKGQDYTQDFSIKIAAVYVPVKSIKDSIAKNALVGETITLTGTAEPENATNKTITWSIADAGTTKATLSGNRLTVKEAGTVKIRATIKNGKTESTDFTKDYSIAVKDAPHIAVKKINNVPTKGWVDQPLQLTGTVDPANATAKTITWSIKDAGTTGATLYGSTLTAKKVGTVKLVATIENGKAKNSAYTQEFTVEMAAFGGEGATISGNKVGLYAPTGRSGIASATITQEAVKAALDSSPGNPSVLINLKASRSAVGFSVNVEKEAVDEMIARNVRTFMVKGHMGELSLSSAGLQQIRKSAKEDVNFKLTRVNVAKLPKAARKKAVGKSAYALSINYYQGNRLMKINKLSLGSVLFGVPAKTNSKLKNPTIASLTNRGRVTKYKLSNYKAEEKKVFLRTKVMGNFIVTNR